MHEDALGSVAWRRRHTRYHYVGTLAATDSGLRLEGRDPATGIELALSIPFSEIEAVLAPNGSGDVLVGEPALVLRLAGSDPVLMCETDPGPEHTAALATRLSSLLERKRPSPAKRSKARRRRRPR
ncbi:MAG: hypothetical protein C5B48_08840 [Candidatus Rokuibacteriota bacterium]|nr:MAG: hypothetical protein C5B48_08840 [Candidatus Rokubacteria bacterium]